MVIIEEDAADIVQRALAFGVEVWESIDPTHRITHAALICAIMSENYSVWRTRAEQAASPDSYQMNVANEKPKPVHLNPAVRARSAITYQRDEIAEDLIT